MLSIWITLNLPRPPWWPVWWLKWHPFPVSDHSWRCTPPNCHRYSILSLVSSSPSLPIRRDTSPNGLTCIWTSVSPMFNPVSSVFFWVSRFPGSSVFLGWQFWELLCFQYASWPQDKLFRTLPLQSFPPRGNFLSEYEQYLHSSIHIPDN